MNRTASKSWLDAKILRELLAKTSAESLNENDLIRRPPKSTNSKSISRRRLQGDSSYIRHVVGKLNHLHRLKPFRSRANSLPGANRPIELGPIRSLVLSLPGPFISWLFCSLELSLPGAKWPGNLVLRKYIATYTRRESSRERNGQGAKGPGSELPRVL